MNENIAILENFKYSQITIRELMNALTTNASASAIKSRLNRLNVKSIGKRKGELIFSKAELIKNYDVLNKTVGYRVAKELGWSDKVIDKKERLENSIIIAIENKMNIALNNHCSRYINKYGRDELNKFLKRI